MKLASARLLRALIVRGRSSLYIIIYNKGPLALFLWLGRAIPHADMLSVFLRKFFMNPAMAGCMVRRGIAPFTPDIKKG